MIKNYAYHAFLYCLFVFLLLPANLINAADSSSFTPPNVTAQNTSGVPVGTIIIWSTRSMPTGAESGKWLECNGQSTNGYPDLRAIVGANVPNYKGMFLRGAGGQEYTQNNGNSVGWTSTYHESGVLGQVQGDSIRQIWGDVGWVTSNDYIENGGPRTSGAFTTPMVGYWAPGGNDERPAFYIGIDTAKVTPTSNEIRPVNVAVRYLIKARP